MLEVDGTGAEVARNVYGTNLISRKCGVTKLTYMYNGHADVTALINSGGTVEASYYYDAFGVILEETGGANNPFKYAGYEHDSETGLYYLKSRHYDPVIARFMQEDTYRGTFDDPLSLNLYTYVLNNPLKYYDPFGYASASVNGKQIGNVEQKATGYYGNLSDIQKAIGGTIDWKTDGNGNSVAVYSFWSERGGKGGTNYRIYARFPTAADGTYSTSNELYTIGSDGTETRVAGNDPVMRFFDDSSFFLKMGDDGNLHTQAKVSTMVYMAYDSNQEKKYNVIPDTTISAAPPPSSTIFTVLYDPINDVTDMYDAADMMQYGQPVSGFVKFTESYLNFKYNTARANYQQANYYSFGVSPETSGAAFDVSMGYLGGKVLESGITGVKAVTADSGSNFNSVNDIVNDPQSLYGKSKADVANILGDGWTEGTYGSAGTGWKFTNGDQSIFYHPEGGIHSGSYYGYSSGATGRIKIVSPEYVPFSGDKATIIPGK